MLTFSFSLEKKINKEFVLKTIRLYGEDITMCINCLIVFYTKGTTDLEEGVEFSLFFLLYISEKISFIGIEKLYNEHNIFLSGSKQLL